MCDRPAICAPGRARGMLGEKGGGWAAGHSFCLVPRRPGRRLPRHAAPACGSLGGAGHAAGRLRPAGARPRPARLPGPGSAPPNPRPPPGGAAAFAGPSPLRVTCLRVQRAAVGGCVRLQDRPPVMAGARVRNRLCPTVAARAGVWHVGWRAEGRANNPSSRQRQLPSRPGVLPMESAIVRGRMTRGAENCPLVHSSERDPAAGAGARPGRIGGSRRVPPLPRRTRAARPRLAARAGAGLQPHRGV